MPGTILGPNGEDYGTYTVDSNGLVTPTFNDDAIDVNSEGTLKGNLRLKLDASNLSASDTGKKIALVEGGSTTVNFVNDLAVSKAMEQTNGRYIKDGKIYYIITVSPKYGTPGDVSLSDVFEKSWMSLSGSVTVKKQDGTDYSQYVASTGGGISGTLPKLAAGESYTITYAIDAPTASISEDVSASNSVKVTSGSLTKTARADGKIYGKATMTKTVQDDSQDSSKST